MNIADDRGFTLIELLVGMTMSLLVLGATLTAFVGFTNVVRDDSTRNDAAEIARTALDAEVRQLRNVAKRVSSPVIDTLQPTDLIFQTADPARTWVRYCLDTTTPPASRERGRLWTSWRAVPSSTTATPVTAAMRGPCPGSGWTSTSIVADYVTNRRGSLDRPLFTYTCRVGTACVASAAAYDEVVEVTARAFVDTTPGTGPAELRISSGAQLRNQNQAPVASFVATPSSMSRTVELNGAASSDYEGRTLLYYWFEQVMPATAAIDCTQPIVTGNATPRTLWGAAGFIGGGISLSHAFKDGVAGETRAIGLVVCDPGDRFGTAGVPPQPTIAVPIPS